MYICVSCIWIVQLFLYHLIYKIMFLRGKKTKTKHQCHQKNDGNEEIVFFSMKKYTGEIC